MNYLLKNNKDFQQVFYTKPDYPNNHQYYKLHDYQEWCMEDYIEQLKVGQLQMNIYCKIVLQD